MHHGTDRHLVRMLAHRQFYLQVVVNIGEDHFLVGQVDDGKNTDPIAHAVVNGRLAGIDIAQVAEVFQAHQPHRAITQRHQRVDPARRVCHHLQV